jgi:hypothetical protein
MLWKGRSARDADGVFLRNKLDKNNYSLQNAAKTAKQIKRYSKEKKENEIQ